MSSRPRNPSDESDVLVLPDPDSESIADSDRLTIVSNSQATVRSGDSDTETVDLNRPNQGVRKRPGQEAPSLSMFTKKLESLPKEDMMRRVGEGSKRRKLDEPRTPSITAGFIDSLSLS